MIWIQSMIQKHYIQSSSSIGPSTCALCHQDDMRDPWDQECYRLLTIMHKNCDKLIQTVQETGDLTREIRQIEDQIGQLKIRQTIDNM